MANPAVKRTAPFTLAALLAIISVLYGWWNPTLIPLAGLVVLLYSCGKSTRRNDGIYRRWLARFCLGTLAGLSALALFNYVIDPLWCFPVSNRWNKCQVPFDERQQKTNSITFGDFDYSTLVVGSSRTIFIDQNSFRGMKAFNYALCGMSPEEYGSYIKYAEKRRGSRFENIIIGFDFFGTSIALKRNLPDANKYFTTANSLLYRYQMLINYRVAKYSVGNIKQCYDRTSFTYDRYNRAMPRPVTAEGYRDTISNQFLWFKNELYGNKYEYDNNLRNIMIALRQENPDTRFIVFTTPESEPVFRVMVKEKRFPDYERWLRDLVDVFGTVYHFMDINSVTTNYTKYFSDTNHTLPQTGALMALRLSGVEGGDVPEDFGKVLTRDNIDTYLASLKKQCGLK